MSDALRNHIYDILEGSRFVRGCGCYRAYESAKRLIRERITPLNYEAAVRYAAEFLGV